MSDTPETIRQLIARCVANETSFDNDDMSLALKFGELLWRRLTRVAEHYEHQSGNFMPHDVRGPMMSQAAETMRQVLKDAAMDLWTGDAGEG